MEVRTARGPDRTATFAGLGPRDAKPDREGRFVATAQRVLVIDGLPETEEVLRAVLEPRGMRVERVRGGNARATLDQPAPPSVVVLHEETVPAPHGGWQAVPRVIIGSVQLPAADAVLRGNAHYRPKPFHYGELIGAIERLLASPQSPAGANCAS